MGSRPSVLKDQKLATYRKQGSSGVRRHELALHPRSGCLGCTQKGTWYGSLWWNPKTFLTWHYYTHSREYCAQCDGVTYTYTVWRCPPKSPMHQRWEGSSGCHYIARAPPPHEWMVSCHQRRFLIRGSPSLSSCVHSLSLGSTPDDIAKGPHQLGLPDLGQPILQNCVLRNLLFSVKYQTQVFCYGETKWTRKTCIYTISVRNFTKDLNCGYSAQPQSI